LVRTTIERYMLNRDLDMKPGEIGFTVRMGLFTGLREEELYYIHDKEICCNELGCKCNNLHPINIDRNTSIMWGGLIAFIYSALNNQNVRSLTLMAAPVDFSKDNTILANWARVIDSDQIIDEFGHLYGQVLNIGFLMRNPPRYTFDKYLNLFERYKDKQFVDDFISVEKWLYDTPIIPGNLYRQVINDCYKNNLLISNKMKVDGNIIDLKNIIAPLLTIIAEDDRP
jgi:polyhydroxyalkanoate synthase